MKARLHPLLTAVLAGWMTLLGGSGVVAQEPLPEPPPEETTTTTSTSPPTTVAEEPVPTTMPAPEDVAPPPPTTAPPPAPTTTVSPPAQPAPAPAPAPLPPPPATQPPAVGGDAAGAPEGAASLIPPDMQAKINSVRRTRANSTVRLLEALAPLRAMGMTEQEAISVGFGRFPVGGRATFGDDWWFPRFVPSFHLHEGTDIFAVYGTPVRAPATGVLKQRFNPVGGLSAYVHEPDGTYYYLAHLSRYEAGQISGQAVRTGDVIGYVGDSGNARGSSPHVHFEVHPRGGGPVNPKPRLDAWLAEALKAVPKVVAENAPRLAARPPGPAAEEQDLMVVGHTDLGADGASGKVTVVGDTALVARGSPSPAASATRTGSGQPAVDAPGDGGQACRSSVTLVDLSQPAAPAVTATIDVAPGQRVEDLDARAVRTPSFTGDLAAVAIAPCAGGSGGLAYYDVSDPHQPRLLARVAHPRELAAVQPGAEACAQELRGTCPRAGLSVQLRPSADGVVVSLSSASAASATRAAGEVYAVDVSDPREPEALGLFPAPGGARPATSNDGCSPMTLTPPGDGADELSEMVDVAGFGWDGDAKHPPGSGPGGTDTHPVVVEAGNRRLAVVSEDHWWSAAWALRLDPPAPLAGDTPGCPGPLAGSGTGTGDGAGPTAGQLVYVGRGCPGRRTAAGGQVPADPYLADPAGRIAVADAALGPAQPDLSPVGCTPAARLHRAREAGALGLVVAGSFLAGQDAGDGAAAADDRGTADGGGSLPGVHLRKPHGDGLRAALCPPGAGGGGAACGPAQPLTASLVELPGQWGGLRVLDVTDPEAPRHVEVFRTASAAGGSPPEAGASYAVHGAVADGSRVYAAWGSDGLRVLDLASGSPVEVASFQPPSRPDPTGAGSAGPMVTGVHHTADHIVVSDLTSGLWILDKRPPPATRGYWLADADGGVYAFGDATFAGSAAGSDLPGSVVGLDPTPSARGYRLVTSDGGVYAFGDASFQGSLGDTPRSSRVVGMASTPTGGGYWLADAGGGVFSFGDAPFLGSLAESPPGRPVVDVVATPSGRGYWLVGEDGGVFAFGDAAYLGSTADTPLPQPIVGAATTATGMGYWLVAEDGGVFAFGDARFKGSLAAGPLPSPVTGVAAMSGVKGYWLAGAEGAVYPMGVPFLGAPSRSPRAAPVVAVAAVPRPPR